MSPRRRLFYSPSHTPRLRVQERSFKLQFVHGAIESWEDVCRRAAARYFVLQAALGALWWIGLLFAPVARPWFGDLRLLWQLFMPDLVVFVLGSLLAGALAWRSSVFATIGAAMVSGATLYVALFLLSASGPAGRGLLGAAIMSAAAFASVIATLLVSARLDQAWCFRRSSKNSWASTLVRTFVQSAVFWGALLVAVPLLVHLLETRAGVPSFGSSTTRVCGVVLFLIASGLNLSAGWVFAQLGDGTPLPLDATNRLVVAGPYRWIRNPMAVSGLTQGLAVGIGLGSPATIAYVVLGGLVWNTLVRPLEEFDLQQRFAGEFERYRAQVRCWVPRLRPVESAGTGQ